MKTKHVVLGACAGLFLASAALAQAPDAAAQGHLDVKKVDDWFVRCTPAPSPSPCDMYEELDSKAGQRVLSLALAYIPSLDRHALQITVPLDVSIPKGLTINTDSYNSPALRYRRCDRNGCYVETAVDNGMVELLAKSGPEGKLTITADNGKTYSLRVSFKGFAAAHDDMVSEARAKAKPVSKTADAPAAARHRARRRQVFAVVMATPFMQ